MITNQQIEDTLHRLDDELVDVRSALDNKVDSANFNTRLNNMYAVLERNITQKFNQFTNQFNSNHSTSQSSGDVYTKDEIDAKGFLTEHQSLDEYVTKDYAEHHYLNMRDVHGLVLTDYAKTSYVNNLLENYITNVNLQLTLGDFAKTEYVDREISKLNTKLEKKGNYATTKYVDSSLISLLSSADNRYITRDYASEMYFSNANQLNFVNYIEHTYATKEELDFAAHGIMTTDVLDEYVKSSDLSDYATKDDVSFLSESISRANAVLLTPEIR